MKQPKAEYIPRTLESIDVTVILHNLETRGIVEATLTGQGYNILFVSDENSALKEIKTNPPDLILLEDYLPEDNGIELCESLKRDALTSEIPIIFITDFGNENILSKCFHFRGIDFIYKPLRKEELKLRTMALLEWYAARKQKQANPPEFNLFNSEHRLKHIDQDSGIGLVYCTTDGKVIDFNEVALQRINKKKSEVIGKTIFELFPKIADRIWQRLQLTVSQDTPKQYEGSIEVNGKSYWFLNLYSTFKNETGKIMGVQIMSLDITEKKYSEKILRQTEALYSSAVSALSEGLVVQDASGKILTANKAATDILGLSLDQIIGRDSFDPWWKALHEDGTVFKREEYPSKIVSKTGNPINNVIMNVHSVDTEKKWLSINAVPIFDENNIQTGTVATFLDITKQRLTKKDLIESEKRFRALFKDAPIPTYIWQYTENDFVLHDYNEAAIKTTQGKIKTLLGIKATELYKEENKQVLQDFYSCFKNKTSIHQEIYYQMNTSDNIMYLNAKYTYIHPNIVMVQTEDFTERRQVELKLKQSTKLLEASQKIAKVGAWEFDITTSHLYWTEETYRIHDTSPSEFTPTIGKGITYFLPESRPIISKALKLAIESGENYDLELEKHTLKGRHIYVRTTCMVTYNEGKPIKLTGIIQDITKQKLTEKKLIESQERFSKAFDNNSVPSAILNLKTGKRIAVNKAYSKVYGYSNSELLNGSLKNNIAADQGEYKSIIKKLLREGAIYNHPFRMRTKSGDIRHTLTNVTKLYPDNDDIFITSNLDVTDRNITLEALKKSEQHLRAIVENSLNAIMVADDLGNYTSANQAAAHMFGYPSEQLLQMNVSQLNTNSDENAIERYHQYLEKGMEIGEFEFIRSDGQQRVVLYHAVRVRENFNLSILSDITKNKRVERSLSETLQQLNLAINTAKLGIWVLTLKTGENNWNDQMLEIYGLSREDFEKDLDGWRSLVHPDDKDYADNRLMDAFEKKSVFDVHFRIIRPGGEIRHLEASATPILDEHGELIKIIGINLDITDRIKAEENIKRTNILLEEMSKTAKVGGWEVDPATMKAYFTEETFRIYGLPETKSLRVEDGLKYFSPEVKSEISTAINNAIKKNIPFDLELPFINAYGENIWVRSIGRPHIEENKPIRIYGAIQDITGQKLAKKKLKESQQKFKTLFENAPYIVALVNKNGNIIDMNRTDPVYKREEVIGSNIVDWLSDDQKIKYRKLAIKAIETGEVQSFDPIIVDPTGLARHWNYRISAMEKNKAEEKLIITFAEITERKRVEAELEEYRLSLEEKVELRTTELQIANAELSKAQQEIKAAFEKEKELGELKSRFIATASHQFRTPLTVIRSNTELMESSVSAVNENKQKLFEKAFNRIKKETRRMTDIMNDILILGKVNAGASTATKESIDIVSITQEMVERLNDVDGVSAKIQMRIINEPRPILLDKNQFIHILINILSNAQKYSLDRGNVDLNIYFLDNKLELVIKDDGIGISKEDQKNLFQPFFRGTNSEGIQGTGLGLSIAHEYVQLNGGEIKVNSQLGVGTTVKLIFNH